MFDSHSVGTGISFSTSSSLSLSLSRLRHSSRSLIPLSLAHTFEQTFSLFLPRSPFRRLSAATAGRSAPDYLGSECLIEALYRWDPESLASLGRPTLLLEFGGDITPPSPPASPPLLPSCSQSPSSPSFPVPLSFSFLSTSTSLYLFVYLLVADTSLPRQIHR